MPAGNAWDSKYSLYMAGTSHVASPDSHEDNFLITPSHSVNYSVHEATTPSTGHRKSPGNGRLFGLSDLDEMPTLFGSFDQNFFGGGEELKLNLTPVFETTNVPYQKVAPAQSFVLQPKFSADTPPAKARVIEKIMKRRASDPSLTRHCVATSSKDPLPIRTVKQIPPKQSVNFLDGESEKQSHGVNGPETTMRSQFRKQRLPAIITPAFQALFTKPIGQLPGFDRDLKPELSYAVLVTQAIAASVEGRLTLKEIYTWIQLTYPFFETAAKSWKNSVRHNLSLHDYFKRVPRPHGKGAYWTIEPEALRKYENRELVPGGTSDRLKMKFPKIMTEPLLQLIDENKENVPPSSSSRQNTSLQRFLKDNGPVVSSCVTGQKATEKLNLLLPSVTSTKKTPEKRTLTDVHTDGQVSNKMFEASSSNQTSRSIVATPTSLSSSRVALQNKVHKTISGSIEKSTRYMPTAGLQQQTAPLMQVFRPQVPLQLARPILSPPSLKSTLLIEKQGDYIDMANIGFGGDGMFDMFDGSFDHNDF